MSMNEFITNVTGVSRCWNRETLMCTEVSYRFQGVGMATLPIAKS